MEYKCKAVFGKIDCPLKMGCKRFMEASEPRQKYLSCVPYWNGECSFKSPLSVSLEEQREEALRDAEETSKDNRLW